MTLIFFGTSDYCLPVLDVLNLNFNLKLVVTRPDKPVGRKKILTPSATKLWAQKNNVPVVTPENLNAGTTNQKNLINQILGAGVVEFLSESEKLRRHLVPRQSGDSRKNLTSQHPQTPPDLAIVADFGQLIPKEIFSLPRLGTFNIHFSKLPDLRGASPVQACLLRGDTTAWITIFQLEETLDTGPILWQKEYPIFPTETAGDLYTRLFQEVAKELPEIINLLAANRLPLTAQFGTPTFCKKFTKDDGFIEWNVVQKARKGENLLFEELPEIQQQALKTINCKLRIVNCKFLLDHYRAVSPWPGLWTLVPTVNREPDSTVNRRMKILKCHLEEKRLVLDEIQFEGKKPQPYTNHLI